MYDFQARTRCSKRRSAPGLRLCARADGKRRHDMGRARARTTGRRRRSGKYEQGQRRSTTTPTTTRRANTSTRSKPMMTAMSAASEASDSQLQTRAQLAGAVEVNFKSDYLPLDKMATPGMIAAIQGNSTPVDPNVVPSAEEPASGDHADAGRDASHKLMPRQLSCHDRRQAAWTTPQTLEACARRCASCSPRFPPSALSPEERSASSPPTWSRCCPTSPTPTAWPSSRQPLRHRDLPSPSASPGRGRSGRGDQEEAVRLARHGRREVQGRCGSRRGRAVRRARQEGRLSRSSSAA